MRRRFSTLSIVSVAAAGLALALGLFFAWFQSGVSARWARLEKRVAELEAESRHRNQARTPILGTAADEDAWSGYAAALAAVAKVWQGRWSKDETTPRWAAAGESWDLESLGAVAGDGVDYAPVLDGLRRGARGIRYEFRPAWTGGFGTNAPGQSSLQFLRQVAAIQAKLRFVEGRDRDGLEILLNLAQFARDLSDNAAERTLSNVQGCWATFVDQTESLLRLWPLSKEDLAFLNGALEALDKTWPDAAPSLWNALAGLGKGMIEEERHDREFYSSNKEDRRRRQARWFWSSRLRASHSFELMERWIREAVALENGPWKDARAFSDNLDAELDAWPDPLLSLMRPWSCLDDGGRRFARARLRLLRAGVAARGGLEIPVLEDPFGDVLKVSVEPRRVRIWSVGFDGMDDRGESQGRMIGGVYRRDLSLELPR